MANPNMPENSTNPPDAIEPDRFAEVYGRIRDELARVVVGQEPVVDHLLRAVFGGGNVLVHGVPGLGRTLLVKTLAEALGLDFSRIQFTPDLLPSDIIGAEILEGEQGGGRHFRFFKGPVFANLVLVDEINRSPARTQAALLEVMQEHQVTAGGKTYFLPRPFILVATENSLDTEGTWPLGEAQVDRFMMSIEQVYPPAEAERRMLYQTTGSAVVEVSQVSSPEEVLAMQALVRDVPVVPSVRDFALAIVRASRPDEDGAADEIRQAVRLGASPRAAQALLLGAKVAALSRGRTHVSRQDVIDVVVPVINHRLLLDVRAAAQLQSRNTLIESLIAQAQSRALPTVSRWTREVLKPISSNI